MTPYNRNRQRTGGAVLSSEQVAVIKRKLLLDFSSREIAESYGVGTETIRRIARGETWGWIEPAGMDGKVLVEKSQADIALEAAASLERFKAMMAGEASVDIPASLASPEQLARAASLGARVGGEAEAGPLDRLLGEANSLLDIENELDKLKEVKP
jgi:hypothetical protein